jgi:heme exporter protein D
MPELGPHAAFIIAAYAVAFVALGGLTLFTVEDDRKQRRLLAELERKGITRRSAARPKPAQGKTATAKPKPAKAPAKRQPAAPRARKTRS